MEQDFSDLVRSGTAPIQKLTLKGGAKGAGAASPIRPSNVKQAVQRPKTSSNSDLTDLNIAFRANRSMNALAASERELQTLGAEGGGEVAASLRREQQDSDYQQLLQVIMRPGAAQDDANANVGNSPAARNAWGSRQGQRIGASSSGNGGGNTYSYGSTYNSGNTLGDDGGRAKKGGLSAYLQSSVPSVLAQQARGKHKSAAVALAATAAAATAAANKERPSNAQKAYASRDIASVYGGLRMGTPNSRRPRNPAVASTQNLVSDRERDREREREREKDRDKERERERERDSDLQPTRPWSNTSLYDGVPPAARKHSASTTVSSSSNLNQNFNRTALEREREREVTLEQSAALAYVGGASAVLRSSTTRSRARLQVNVASVVGASLEDSDLDHLSSGTRPQTYSGQGAGRPMGPSSSSSGLGLVSTTQTNTKSNTSSSSSFVAPPRYRAGAANDDDEEITEVTEEIVMGIFTEPSPTPSPRLLRLQEGIYAAAAGATRERSSSHGSHGSYDRVTPSPSFKRDSPGPPSSTGTGLQRRSPPPPEMASEPILIGDPADSTRRLDRPQSRKPYLGSGSTSGNGDSDTGNNASSSTTNLRSSQDSRQSVRSFHSAGAVRKQPSVPSSASLKRVGSFSGSNLAAREEQWLDEKQRPPSRQSSAFPIHLAEPNAKPDIANVDASKERELQQSKRPARPSGQPVNLDDLDSDDEIFTRREKQPYSPRRMHLQGVGSISSQATSSEENAAPSPLSSSKRGSHSVLPRRGADPVADGFTALGNHDEQWPFAIKVNYEPEEDINKAKHTPRHILDLEQRNSRMWGGASSAAGDDIPDDLSELDLEIRSQRSGSPHNSTSPRASPSQWLKSKSRDQLTGDWHSSSSTALPRSGKNSLSSINAPAVGWSKSSSKQSFDDAGLRAASPSYGLYDDDGDSDDDEDSIMTEQEGVLEASHGTFSLESSLPEDFLNLFSIM